MKAAERDSVIALLKSLDRATLNEVIENAGLTWREKAVLGQRFGLELVPRLTFKQIAKKYGVSMTRIREIERRALLRPPSRQAVAVVSEAVDRVKALTPELMRHLKFNTGDCGRCVGRSSSTLSESFWPSQVFEISSL